MLSQWQSTIVWGSKMKTMCFTLAKTIFTTSWELAFLSPGKKKVVFTKSQLGCSASLVQTKFLFLSLFSLATSMAKSGVLLKSFRYVHVLRQLRDPWFIYLFISWSNCVWTFFQESIFRNTQSTHFHCNTFQPLSSIISATMEMLIKSTGFILLF